MYTFHYIILIMYSYYTYELHKYFVRCYMLIIMGNLHCSVVWIYSYLWGTLWCVCDWGWKMHPECRCYHSVGWGPALSEMRQRWNPSDCCDSTWLLPILLRCDMQLHVPAASEPGRFCCHAFPTVTDHSLDHQEE